MSITTSPRITIVGAGIAGSVLGRCLLKRGIKATILEKAHPSPHRNNYGITLYSKSYRPLLKILDLDEGAFRKRVAVDAGEGGAGGRDDDVWANRGRFEDLLGEGLEVQWGRSVEKVQGTTVHINDGGAVEAEIIVGADGPHSVVRGAVAPQAELKVLPFAVYNGKRRLPAKELKMVGWRGENAVEHRVGTSVFQIAINDIDGEEISLSYTYSRPAKGEGHDPLYRPARPKEAAKDIPEGLFKEINTLHAQLPPGLFQHIFHADGMRHDRLLNWLMRASDLQNGADQSIVLIGDAAHAEPILGPSYGANEAIEDSIALADFLAAETRRPLGEFFQDRVEIWRAAVRESEVRIQDMHTKASGSLWTGA